MKALATFAYMMITLAFGLWMICQLWTPVSKVVSDVKGHVTKIEQLFDKLD